MYHVPYHRHPGFRPLNALVPGNDVADNPLEFDLAPAWGPDLARIRSIITASLGLSQEADWSDQVQQVVISSFEHGAPAFINTIEAIRGLTIPAGMARRAGLITDANMPVKPGTKQVDADAPVAVTTGYQFSRICGALPAIALHVATKIAEISQKAEGIDPRFFAQPSGSGGNGMQAATAGTAASARRTPRRRGTAANAGTPAAK